MKNDYISPMKEAALAAGKMLRDEQLEAESIDQNYKDFVTQQDLKSESKILEILGEAFPEIPAYSEEAGGEFSQEGLRWVIDPLDGTISYYKGNPEWGVSIALIENGVSVAGVVYLPIARQLFSATIDTPTEMTEDGSDKIVHPKVSVKTELTRCNVAFDYGKPGLANPPENPFWQIMEKMRRIGIHGQIPTSSTAYFMKMVSGEIDGIIGQPDPFDTAASGLILKKAGGRVTDFRGNDWKCYANRTLATNGKIHNQLLSILND
ncbi:MAG: myo-inositol-1(or 4)-monophosphatase [Parcubacteria group bacterium Gr01-1014_20]|nr:MAG: myo-inositol-1(or 4)-monophosphatase [Parcubacteria group bacterium Gr01-1014_20]